MAVAVTVLWLCSGCTGSATGLACAIGLELCALNANLDVKLNKYIYTLSFRSIAVQMAAPNGLTA